MRIARWPAAVTLCVVVACSGGAPVPPKDGIVLGLGDSIAAGQGLGKADGYPNNPSAHPALVAARLGWRSYNLAIARSCAATAGAEGAHELTPEGCTTSVLSDQIPRLDQILPSAPDLVIVMVGGNDIRFAECAADILLPVTPAGDEGCDDEVVARRATALTANLTTVLREVRRRYARARIAVSTYYNPAPSPPPDDGDACPLIEPVAAFRRPLSLASDGLLRRAVAEVQAELYVRVQKVVDALNDAIRNAAAAVSAATGRVDFDGHDFCRTETGGTLDDVWVFGPDVDISFDLPGSTLFGGGKRWRYTLPFVCPEQSQEPKPFEIPRTTRRIGVLNLIYSVRVGANCAPHLTLGGQRALADAILAVLPPGFAR